MILGVNGPLAPTAVGAVLSAETLLRDAPPPAGNIGQAASVSAFERAPVTIENLGRLLLGAANRDDRTLTEVDAEAALRALPRDGVTPPLVVVLADSVTGRAADPAVLRRLSRATGVSLVRGVFPDPASWGLAPRDETLPDSAGIVGAIPPSDAHLVAVAATAAALTGLPLALAPATGFSELAAALSTARAAGLTGERILVTGVRPLLAAAGTGVADARLDELIELLVSSGAWLCVDDLGRIPTVRTVVSDHDLALAIRHMVERGLGDRITLSVGLRNKHRLTAFGGNGLEFVADQYLPYLGMCGVTDAARRGLAGENASRFLVCSDGGTA